MGFITEKVTKTKTMGLLLVFFPEQSTDRNTLLSLPSSSSSSSSSIIRRTKSSSLILTKAQSTISICFFFLLFTLFLFTLSTFEPTVPSRAASVGTYHRRFLTARNVGRNYEKPPLPSFALQGMGTLFLRGTRTMHELLLVHVTDDVTGDDLRLFLRLIHRSGVTSKSDVVFLFPSGSSISRFGGLIRKENDSFLRLLESYRRSNESNRADSGLGFDATRFLKHWKPDTAEPIWGKRSGRAAANASATDVGDSIRVSYGSVLGFEATELDPENSLSGFFTHVPMRLRRWACYPMLLGRVRHSFKQVMLVDAKSSLVIGDPLRRVRGQGAASVIVFSKHGARSWERAAPSRSAVNPAVVMGGAKGVRRLSRAMLTEIVRASMQHKKKNAASESAVLTQLVANAHIAKNFNVMISSESIPDTSSLLSSSVSASRNRTPWADHDIIHHGNSNNCHDLITVFLKQICSNAIDSSVYSDC